MGQSIMRACEMLSQEIIHYVCTHINMRSPGLDQLFLFHLLVLSYPVATPDNCWHECYAGQTCQTSQQLPLTIWISIAIPFVIINGDGDDNDDSDDNEIEKLVRAQFSTISRASHLPYMVLMCCVVRLPVHRVVVASGRDIDTTYREHEASVRNVTQTAQQERLVRPVRVFNKCVM